MRYADAVRRALLSVRGARSTTVKRVGSRGQETIEGRERRAREDTPAAGATGVRCDAAVAGYTLTGRALAEPEEACGLEHAMRDSS
jgi:hypothetical protein